MRDVAQLAEMLLELKTRASKGTSWTDDERAKVDLCLQSPGITRVLAACCVLSSKRPEGCRRALSVIREAIEQQHQPPYVELLIYETLTIVETRYVVSFAAEILRFIQQTLNSRTINLDNTIFLLGRLARSGEGRALVLLKSLVQDNDPEIRSNASLVLRGIENQKGVGQ